MRLLFAVVVVVAAAASASGRPLIKNIHKKAVHGRPHDFLPILQPFSQAVGGDGLVEAFKEWAASVFEPLTAMDLNKAAGRMGSFVHDVIRPGRERPLPPIPHPGFTSDMGTRPPAETAGRRLQTAPTSAHRSANCSGVGSFVNSTGLAFTCEGVEVSEAFYDAVLDVQETGSQAAIDALDDLLPDNFDFDGIIPEDTGITVNLSQIFSGQTLDDIVAELNITDPREPIDIGELLNDPNLNTTEILDALPRQDIDDVIDSVSCTTEATSELQCACPRDYAGTTCESPRQWTCSLRVGDAAYRECLATNGAGATGTGYRPDIDGDPPCMSFSPQAAQPMVVPLAVSCGFVDDEDDDQRCNGTTIDTAFIEDQAAAQNVSVTDLPGAAPYYNFHCVETLFEYAVGTWNTSFALTSAPSPVNITFRPVNFYLLSDVSLRQQFALDSTDLLSGATFDATLPVDNLPPQFVAGGRLYTEVIVAGGLTNASTLHHVAAFPTFVAPVTTRLVVDEDGYVEPSAPGDNTALVVGLTVMAFVILVAAGVAVWYFRFREAAQARGAEVHTDYARIKSG